MLRFINTFKLIDYIGLKTEKWILVAKSYIFNVIYRFFVADEV